MSPEELQAHAKTLALLVGEAVDPSLNWSLVLLEPIEDGHRMQMTVVGTPALSERVAQILDWDSQQFARDEGDEYGRH